MSKDTELNKALKVIDALTMAYETGVKNLENAESILSTIYRVSHSIVKDHSCYDVHESWRKEINRLYKEFKKMGYV